MCSTIVSSCFFAAMGWNFMRKFNWALGGVVIALLTIILGLSLSLRQQELIKVGVLHSLSGTMSISESSVVDANLLAIKGINTQSGLLGRTIQPIISDSQLDS